MIYLYLLLKNVASIACFTVLAIHFEKWWIALFALLFCSYIESKK